MTVYGIDCGPLPDGCQPIEALGIVKALDKDGGVCVYRRASGGWTPWELLGILEMLTDAARDEAQDGMEFYEFDDEGEE